MSLASPLLECGGVSLPLSYHNYSRKNPSPLSHSLAEALEDPTADGIPGGPPTSGGGAPPPAATYGDYADEGGYGDAYGDYEKGQVRESVGEKRRGEKRIGSPRVAGAASLSLELGRRRACALGWLALLTRQAGA